MLKLKPFFNDALAYGLITSGSLIVTTGHMIVAQARTAIGWLKVAWL